MTAKARGSTLRGEMTIHKTQPVLTATSSGTALNAIILLLDSFNVVHLSGLKVAAINGVLLFLLGPMLRTLVTPNGKAAKLVDIALACDPSDSPATVNAIFEQAKE